METREEITMIYYVVYAALGLCVLQFLVLMLAKDPIKLKLQSLIKRKKDFLLVTRCGKDLRRSDHVAKYDKGLVQLKGGRYHIEQEHIYFSPVFGIPSVIVSDVTASSINPNSAQNSAVKPSVIDDSIHAAVMGQEFELMLRWMKLNTAAVIIAVLGMAICGFVMYLLVTAAKDAGMVLGL